MRKKAVVALSVVAGLLLAVGNLSAASGKCERAIKIGVVTGTVSQGEDEYRAAQQITKKYGKECVIHLTYPDNFMQEQETTISMIESLAADPQLKGILVGQAVPGTIAAARKIRRKRKDIAIVGFESHEDPDQVDKSLDLVFSNDNVTRGTTIPKLAKQMGAKTLIHISFPRHMSYKILSDRWKIMQKVCKEIGLKCLFRSAIDPLSAEGGIAAAQQSVPPIVRSSIKQYGRNTAFFCTNDAMTEPLIRTVAEVKAIFTEPDMPSPTMGYPGAFGIAIPSGKAGDYDFINAQISKAVDKFGNGGRMACWPRPAIIVSMKAAADVLFHTNADRNVLQYQPVLETYLKSHAGVNVKLTRFGTTKNYQLVLMDDIIYGTPKTKKAKKSARRRKASRRKKKI